MRINKFSQMREMMTKINNKFKIKKKIKTF